MLSELSVLKKPQVLSLVEAAIPDLDERGLSNCMHCMAVLELNQERQLLRSMLAAAENILQTSGFAPQGLANLTWALGTLRVNPGPRLSAQLLAAAGSNLGKFQAVELAQYGWGLASLHLRVEEAWLKPWRKAVVRVLPQVTPQGLSMLLWATARLSETQQLSVSAAAAAAVAGSSAGAAGVSSSSSSSSSVAAEQQEGAFLQAAEATFQQQLKQHTPHSVSMCLWALAKMGHRPSRDVTGETKLVGT